MILKFTAVFFICCLYVSLSWQLLTGQFWHVTDIHWDKNYTQNGGNPRNMCWAPVTNSIQDDGPPMQDLGQFGNYACDSPWELFVSTLQFMKSYKPDADYILWTGDDDSHVSDYFFSPTKVREIMTNVSLKFNETFPNTPIIPTFGNHDAYPKSTFPSQVGSDWYLEVANMWRPWLGEEAYLSFKKGGYYTKNHPTLTNVTVIGLNTPVYYQNNKLARAKTDLDPLQQVKWLDATLNGLASQNRKAYIVAHISPGVFGRKVTPKGYRWFQNGYNKQYLKTIIKHSDTIIGQFYGHDHTDSFKLYYDNQNTPVNLHLVAPAVTPWNTTLSGIGPNNPGVRLVTYDLQTGRILNYHQFYLNLSEANTLRKADWKLEYDFLSAYNLPDMSYQSIDTLVQGFASGDRTYFNKYYEYNSVSYTSADQCDAQCQRNHYCAITRVDYNDFYKCNDPAANNITVSNETVDIPVVHRRLVRGPEHQQVKRWID